LQVPSALQSGAGGGVVPMKLSIQPSKASVRVLTP